MKCQGKTFYSGVCSKTSSHQGGGIADGPKSLEYNMPKKHRYVIHYKKHVIEENYSSTNRGKNKDQNKDLNIKILQTTQDKHPQEKSQQSSYQGASKEN